MRKAASATLADPRRAPRPGLAGGGRGEGGRGAAAIASELGRAIEDGVYAHEEQLPPERVLAARFGAARSTVRKALRRLEDEGFVRRRVGSGTFVTRARSDDVAELTSPLELIDARFAVEPHMVRLAVLNATNRDIERLGEALARLEAVGPDREAFGRHDGAFHQALAESTHNPLFVALYRQVNEVRSHAQWHAMKELILTPANIAAYNRQHRALLEALRSRDVEGAVAVISGHLEKARRDLLGAESR